MRHSNILQGQHGPFILAFIVCVAIFQAPQTLKSQIPAFKVDTAGSILLNLNTDAGLVIKGAFGTGRIPAESVGARQMWYPAKAAFRAGYVDSSQWNEAEVGDYSAAFGFGTTGKAHSSFAVGRYNVGGGTPGSWVGTEPLFEIGNGSSYASPSNAFTVLKDGKVGIGTATPGAELEVNGQVKITGGNPGAGKILMSDASGLAGWSTGGFISGSGATGEIPFFNNPSMLTTSPMLVYDNVNSRVGIGAVTPEFKLSLDLDGGIIAVGTQSSGNNLITSGPGTRLIWYPRKSAFRAGYVGGTEWNNSNIGDYSAALGQYTIASATSAFATGAGATASGAYSTAMGYSTTASGASATALGELTNALNAVSTATGYKTIAYGDYTTSMGTYVSTNNFTGSFIIGDASSLNYTYSTTGNQMMMRFAGGYILYTNAGITSGVYVNGGGGSWASICDRNKKENFRQVDGEEILAKIRELPITRWNYKSNNPSVEYIGPVAQDFWQAFRLGGDDSLGITTLAMDGVNIAAIKALEKRTAELRATQLKLEAALDELRSTKNELHSVRQETRDLNSRIRQIEALLRNQYAGSGM